MGAIEGEMVMKQVHISSILLVVFACMSAQTFCKDTTYNVPWTVVGAGPAGIAVVGILMDSGVLPEQIVWLDPEFNVGRMGKFYQNVPGNAKVSQYISFLKACDTFSEVKSVAIDYLFSLAADKTPELKVIVNPLQDITNYLIKKVSAVQDVMLSLDFRANQWHINTNHSFIKSDHVILATGSHPRSLTYNGIPQIPLDMAVDKAALATYLSPDDKVAVIGSAHSALLIVKYLTELPVSLIVNFYKKPIVFPTPMSGGVAWQEAGLKGELAAWVKNTLLKNPPANVMRIFNGPDTLQPWLTVCTKLIFAGGFDRNELPPINGDATKYDKYDCTTGTIGPRLFGVGIAFPQQKIDPLGNVEYLVGLPFFMPYIQQMVPEWMKKKLNRRLYEFKDLFEIKVL